MRLSLVDTPYRWGTRVEEIHRQTAAIDWLLWCCHCGKTVWGKNSQLETMSSYPTQQVIFRCLNPACNAKCFQRSFPLAILLHVGLKPLIAPEWLVFIRGSSGAIKTFHILNRFKGCLLYLQSKRWLRSNQNTRAGNRMKVCIKWFKSGNSVICTHKL